MTDKKALKIIEAAAFVRKVDSRPGLRFAAARISAAAELHWSRFVDLFCTSMNRL
jgi:hypothetical protein